MSPEEYIDQRVDQQIAWYSRKSKTAQNWFKSLRMVEIIAAASIPILAGFGTDLPHNTFTLALLGSVIAVIASFVSLNQYQENWMAYRTTCESLKHEKFLFLTKAERYSDADPFLLFVQQVEGLISKENSAWSQYTKAGTAASKPNNKPNR